MTLSATVKAMADAGCTPQQIAAAVVAYEAAAHDAQAARRAKDAERQRRNRARVQNVTRTHADSEGQVSLPPPPSFSPLNNPPITTPSTIPSGDARQRADRPQLSADDLPDDATGIATDAGLDAAATRRQWRRFVNHQIGKGARLSRWQNLWSNWVEESREPRQPKTTPARNTTTFVTKDDPRWAPLADEWLRQKGKPPPVVGDGWHFPNPMLAQTTN